MDRLTVDEAAQRLKIGPAAVRRRIAAGHLPAVKRGRSWWLDANVVDGAARQAPGAGQPLSARMAWAVLLLASGEVEAADRVAGRDRYRSRARAWLAAHPLAEDASRVRARARREDFDIHPSEVAHLRRRPDVVATGISASEAVGLVGGADAVEVYAPESQRDEIVRAHALQSRPGPARIRWVSAEFWPAVSQRPDGIVPRAAILVDLLEHDDPRARREAARLLAG